jgi:ABC-type phosphate transport system substrate-binding protein
MLRVPRRQFLISLPALGLLFRSPTVWSADLELAVIVHPANGVTRLSRIELEKIFTAERGYWSSDKIIALNLPARSDARVLFDREVLRMDADQIGRYWIDRKVRGGDPPPRTVPDPALVRRLVAKLEAGIGYVPVGLVDSSVRVVARVKQGAVSSP